MLKNKPSFFERLTGSVDIDDFEEADEPTRHIHPAVNDGSAPVTEEDMPVEDEPQDGQLSVDVYQTQNQNEIVIKAIVAGVKPDDLDVSITRDMVTIRGKREEAREAVEDGYFYRELYWGSFSRTVLLPEEVDIEEAQAFEKHGLLIIRLPKVDKGRQAKLKVKIG